MEQNYKYTLSVIIVNYNVAYFLEQCLNSVQEALSSVNGEVFIVDNNSIDGSVEMVQRKFPNYNLLVNKENVGFSKANNQAILQSNSKYILLLNPDTVVEENTFSKVIEFMEEHPNAGGIGVRMLDGKGNFLPESKRGLPTPLVAFYKIFGLSKLFPRSKKFGQYHAGHLDEFKTSKIEILSGAFMLLRKEALNKIGLLDEDYFMYGEDIDLSYRILKGGYENYYFPETRIIHYKGESTKKSSLNYVFVFYRAMIIFAEKHFSQKNAKLFSFLINLAIYFRAFLALVSRFIKRSILPLIDFSIIVSGLFFISKLWEDVHIFFPFEITRISVPLYTCIWMFLNLIFGTYDTPPTFMKFVKGTLAGLLVILPIYALFPKEWQFSRLFILTGTAWVFCYYSLSRIVLHIVVGKRFSFRSKKHLKFAIVGSIEEFKRVSHLLMLTHDKIEEFIRVSVGDEKEADALGTINQLDQITHIHKVDEVIFCAKDTSAQTIIHWMSCLDSSVLDFKIAQPDSLSLIGSNSIEAVGDLYVLDINAISKPEKIRSKRLFDFGLSLLMILLSPFIVTTFKHKKQFIINMILVLTGRMSLVGYSGNLNFSPFQLPRIKKGILTPNDQLSKQENDLSDKLNLIYARDYTIRKDLIILSKAWKKLDR